MNCGNSFVIFLISWISILTLDWFSRFNLIANLVVSLYLPVYHIELGPTEVHLLLMLVPCKKKKLIIIMSAHHKHKHYQYIFIIIHSKYVAISDWLQSPG